MAFVNRLDARTSEVALATWLATKLPDATEVTVTDFTVPSANGRSSETALFTASWTANGQATREELVARVQPTGEVLFPHYDLVAEFGVMKAVGEHTSAPVPKVRWLETDPGVLGSPFLVMERASGQAPPDEPPFPFGSWVTELSPAQQGTLYDNALGALAAIHSADPDKLGVPELADPDRGFGGLEAQIAHYERFFADQGEAVPTVEAAFAWVKANRPAEERLVVSWGDARLGNMMFGPDQAVTAVLDWELAGLGSPELDLGWWLFFDRHHTEGVGAPRPPGFPDRAAAVARYEELAGRKVEDLDFYEAFAALRTSVLMVRIARIMTLGGLLPPGAGMAQSNPATHLLARMLDLPAPQGQSFSALGNDS